MIRKALAAVALCAVVAMAIGAGPVAAEDGKKVAKGSKVQANQGHSSGHRSNGGRNVAAGVAAGVVGAIILNEAARASSGDGHLRCRQLDRRCDDGQEWACRKLARNC
jgi:hypothetical protein